jgi:4'-phosphopantetheinyl transferase
MDPERLAFVEGPFGKPRLEAVDAPEFSLSHCGDLAALAVARGASVGLDIETLRQFPRADRIASRIFCAQEWADYAALDPADRPQAFFRAWTRKEAYLKAIGDGFATAPETVNVTLAPDDPPRLRGVCGRPDEPARWTLCDVTPAPGVVGALAVSASDIRLRWIRDEEDAP